MQKNQNWLKWAGIVLILVTGLIHVVDAPDAFEESTVKGVLFILNAVGAVVAAYGIFRNQKSYGWVLGIVVAAGAFVSYILSRTVGFPGMEVEGWGTLGYISLVVEALFTLVAVYALTRAETHSNLGLNS